VRTKRLLSFDFRVLNAEICARVKLSNSNWLSQAQNIYRNGTKQAKDRNH
jgi:hypothetical protein